MKRSEAIREIQGPALFFSAQERQVYAFSHFVQHHPVDSCLFLALYHRPPGRFPLRRKAPVQIRIHLREKHRPGVY